MSRLNTYTVSSTSHYLPQVSEVQTATSVTHVAIPVVCQSVHTKSISQARHNTLQSAPPVTIKLRVHSQVQTAPSHSRTYFGQSVHKESRSVTLASTRTQSAPPVIIKLRGHSRVQTVNPCTVTAKPRPRVCYADGNAGMEHVSYRKQILTFLSLFQAIALCLSLYGLGLRFM